MPQPNILDDESLAPEPLKLSNDEKTPYDIDWTEYVLSLLSENEIKGEKPTVAGLRRICGQLLGQIVSSETNVIQCPTGENGHRATVVHSITIETEDNTLTFDGATDVWSGNTTSPFNKYPVAVAETIAEGRALKRALKLNCLVAEEGEQDGNTIPDISAIITDTKLTDTQAKAISVKAKELNVNVEKLLEYDQIENRDNPSKKDGTTILALLNSFQQNPSSITENVKGYNQKWRN